MDVRTTRFGVIDIAEDRVITFERGLFGFPQHRRFCLLHAGDENAFLWMQSLDDQSLAFVVTDPSLFVEGYEVPVRPEQLRQLGIDDPADAQVLVIVNKVDDHLTANLQGPIVISSTSKLGEQLVLAEKRWTTRHTLLRLPQATAQSA